MNALSSLSSRNRHSVLVIIFDFFILGLGAILIGSFLPTMREEYELGYSLSGILVSVYNFGNIAIGLITGFLALFFGRKRCYLVLTVLTSVGFLLMLATRQSAVLLPAFLMAGLARGAGVNYGNGVINELSHDNASLLNLVNALFALGALLAPFLLLGLDTCGRRTGIRGDDGSDEAGRRGIVRRETGGFWILPQQAVLADRPVLALLHECGDLGHRMDGLVFHREQRRLRVLLPDFERPVLVLHPAGTIRLRLPVRAHLHLPSARPAQRRHADLFPLSDALPLARLYGGIHHRLRAERLRHVCHGNCQRR